MAFSSLSTEIVSLIADNLGPRDISSLSRTSRRFNNALSARFYDIALTYTRITGETVLLWAALHNREATFRSLLERGADISIKGKDGDTVLHHLATKGNPYLVTLLLQNPHNIDLRNEKGETPLLCAVQTGNEEVVDQLLEAGADPSLSTTAGPEDEARRQLELEIYKHNRVQSQCRRGVREIYVKRGYNVGRFGERFKKPLHFAAQKGHRNIVKLLLNAGVDASATTYDKRTALDYATGGNHKDVIQLLLAAGIDASKKDYSGMTASDYNSPVEIRRDEHGNLSYSISQPTTRLSSAYKEQSPSTF